MTKDHQNPVENYRVNGLNTCPECGGTYKGANVFNHLRKKHNVWGGVSGRVRNDIRYNRRGRRPTTRAGRAARRASQALEVYQEPLPVTVEPPPVTGLRFPPNLRVGLGEDGSMWICEQVRSPRGRS